MASLIDIAISSTEQFLQCKDCIFCWINFKIPLCFKEFIVNYLFEDSSVIGAIFFNVSKQVSEAEAEKGIKTFVGQSFASCTGKTG